MLEPGEPFLSEYTISAEPFSYYDPGLFEVTVIRRTEDLWSVSRFGHQRWWNGSDWDWRYGDDNEESLEEWQANHRWPLDEALEQGKKALRLLKQAGMTYDEYLVAVEKRNSEPNI